MGFRKLLTHSEICDYRSWCYNKPLKTFEDDLLNYYPETEYIYTLLDEQLEYVAETVKNIIIIISDLINSY